MNLIKPNGSPFNILYVLEDESGIQMRSMIQIKIHETLPNGQYNEITPESPYSILEIQNNNSRSSQVSIKIFKLLKLLIQTLPY